MRLPALKKRYFDIILAFISAVLLILSFPLTNLEFFAWFAFVPLFFALKSKNPSCGFLLSYLCGLIFFAGTIYWLVNVTFIGFVLAFLYLALYFGIFVLIITCYSLLATRYSLIYIPAVWVLLEYLRSHLFTGFGWALLGYSQYLNLPIIQIVNITGVWGVSFLVMMVNVLIYSLLDSRLSIFIKKRKSTLPITYCTFAIFLLFLSLGYGFYRLYRMRESESRIPITISVIQGNIPQAIKWEETARGRILEEYLRLSRLAAFDNPDLIIWPEAALPGILGMDTDIKRDLKAFVCDIHIPLLVGAITLDGGNYYNNAILISEQGRFIQRYDKLHLVPFGEYIPLKRIFGFLEAIVPIGDFNPGKEYTIFSFDPRGMRQNAIHFSVLICFEDIFPQISRQFVKREADFLVNITNDAWFGNTSSPYQHLSASVFRAVENGVYLVRAANTGISGFITPEGRVYPLIDNDSGRQTFVSGYKTRDIFPNLKQNGFYAKWGDWLVLICGLIVMWFIIRIKGTSLKAEN